MPQSMNSIQIGVIIANYNNGKFFKELLNGLLSQTLKPNHVIVIDDCSTDDSLEIIEKELLSRVKNSGTIKGYIDINGIKFWLQKNQTNKGAGATRNVGLKFLLDKTDVIFILDSDDYYYPTKISKSVEVMKKFPEVCLVYSDYDTEDQNGNVKREYKEIYNSDRLREECIVSNNSAIATAGIRMVGFQDESIKMSQDFQYWQRLSEIGAVHHIPEALYRYRLHGSNLTLTTSKEDHARELYKIRQQMIERQKTRGPK